MMNKKQATVLEIGSSKLKVIVGREGINNTFDISDSAETEYDGYFEGEFVDFDKLKTVLAGLFDSIDYIKKKYNKKIYVGLPAEFVGVEVVDTELNFDISKKIRQADIDMLYAQAAEKVAMDEIEIISTSAISFSIDDGGRILSDPIGKKAKKICAEVSVVIAEKETIQKLNGLFSDLDFIAVEYVSETLAEAMLIIPEEEREHKCLMIDVGHLSTSVSFVKGNGILSSTAYSLGGGYITGDLTEEFDLSYKEAEKLKKQMVISVKGDRGDCYDLITDTGVKRIKLQEANNVAIDRVHEIGRAINQCIQNFSDEFILFLPTYLTGEALTKLKGGKDYLSKCIARNIVVGAPDVPGRDKPEYSVPLGLLNYALKGRAE